MTIKTDRGTYFSSPVINTLGPAGWWFIDGMSGVKITRLTDEKDGSGFGTTYSIWPSVNCNNTRLWIYSSSSNSYHTAEFDPATATRVGPLKPVAPIGGRFFANLESALWSGVDPDKLFLFVDAKLYCYQPSGDIIDSNGNQVGTPYTLVKDLTPILGADYSFRQQFKSRDDKRFAASGPLGFVVYDAEQDRVLLDVRTTDMNGIALDRSGKWLLYVPEDDHTEFIYNVELGTKEQIISDPITGLPDYTIGHCDVGTNMIAGNDRWRGAITARKFSTPHLAPAPFVYAPYWISHHLSMTADDEQWALLSTYGDVVGPADPNKFKDECFQVGIQGEAVGKIRRLFHHRVSFAGMDWNQRYWATPKASLSRDGRFVFFTSNMGQSRSDLYVAQIEPASSTAPSPTPDPIPVPLEPTPTPTPEPTPIPIPIPGPNESPDGTKAITITDSMGAVWTIGFEKQTLRNGVHVGRGAGLIYKYVSKVVDVLGTDGKTWYKWDETSWREIGAEPGVTAPIPSPTPVPTPQPAPSVPEVRKVAWPTGESKQNAVVEAQWKERFRWKRHLTGAYVEFERVA